MAAFEDQFSFGSALLIFVENTVKQLKVATVVDGLFHLIVKRRLKIRLLPMKLRNYSKCEKKTKKQLKNQKWCMDRRNNLDCATKILFIFLLEQTI